MAISNLFDTLSPWIICLGVVLILIVSAWLGVQFAKWRKKHVQNEQDAPINTLVGASLALLAFILAFTFGMSTTRFDTRKQYLLEEVNAIETSYLRAGLIDEPFQTEARNLLKEYVNIRVKVADISKETPGYIIESEKIHQQIWELVTDMVNSNSDDRIDVLFITSVNQMIDYHTMRKTVYTVDRIPGMFWLALFVLIILSMFAVGYLFGKADKPNWMLILALSVAFSAIIVLIVDLDSTRGTIKINHKPMIELQQKINQ